MGILVDDAKVPGDLDSFHPPKDIIKFQKRLLINWVKTCCISREWMPDNSSRTCVLCNNEFTFFHRKHHCRECGALICSHCSVFTANNRRICNECFKFSTYSSYTKPMPNANLIKNKSPYKKRSKQHQPYDFLR
ncbi:MAG: hypothetical protein GY710_15640 [Desulfobacteraceae bacterium]|nr:hypothetical protein [Desulfobacteraceae bacterium]